MRGTLIGPVLGHYLACTTENSDEGYHAAATVEGGRHSGEKVRLGPFPDRHFAQLMLLSHVRLQIENRRGLWAQ